jgi:hypothetical protein
MERQPTGMSPAPRISIEQVAAAGKKVRAMDVTQKMALADEIFAKQPHLLASCLVQPRLGVGPQSVEFLLDILFVCFQAMKESGLDWPLITEDEQDRQMARMVGAARFSEDFVDPTLGAAARDQFLANHLEEPLLAFVLREINVWLQELASRKAEAEPDKFVMMASFNMVNCIAHADVPGRCP